MRDKKFFEENEVWCNRYHGSSKCQQRVNANSCCALVSGSANCLSRHVDVANVKLTPPQKSPPKNVGVV